MATNYQIINVKESNFNDAENVVILCYSDDKAKYLISGSNTESLKMKKDDFNFAIRSHGYDINKLEGKCISPKFGRFDYLEDFTLSDPETGEVI